LTTLFLVNIGLLGGLGYLLYTEPQYRTDYKVLGGVAAGGLVILGIEGAVAESYLQTPEGQREKERAEQEGSKLYLQTKEIVLRPGVFGGILGVGTFSFFRTRNIHADLSFQSTLVSLVVSDTSDIRTGTSPPGTAATLLESPLELLPCLLDKG
jgi:hypothetical protein